MYLLVISLCSFKKSIQFHHLIFNLFSVYFLVCFILFQVLFLFYCKDPIEAVIHATQTRKKSIMRNCVYFLMLLLSLKHIQGDANYEALQHYTFPMLTSFPSLETVQNFMNMKIFPRMPCPSQYPLPSPLQCTYRSTKLTVSLDSIFPKFLTK